MPNETNGVNAASDLVDRAVLIAAASLWAATLCLYMLLIIVPPGCGAETEILRLCVVIQTWQDSKLDILRPCNLDVNSGYGQDIIDRKSRNSDSKVSSFCDLPSLR